jgi:hypothetical protein
MPRICIAAALALLALLAPTASARVIDAAPQPKAEQAAHYLVQSERITDTGARLLAPQYDSKTAPHYPVQSADRAAVPTGSLAGTTDETTAAFAQEQAYASQADAVAALADKQPATSTAGGSHADVDGPPWAVLAVAVMGAALAGGLTLATRRTRARAAA